MLLLSSVLPPLYDRAHGRLGTGDSRCRHRPVRLKSWPADFPGCVVQHLALGAAHSLLLAHRSVPTTLANPWGTESIVYAWGYGFYGQLGLGRDVRRYMDECPRFTLKLSAPSYLTVSRVRRWAEGASCAASRCLLSRERRVVRLGRRAGGERGGGDWFKASLTQQYSKRNLVRLARGTKTTKKAR